jgi:hypothetical protein
VVSLVIGALGGLLISTKKREKNEKHKVRRNLVQEELETTDIRSLDDGDQETDL